MNGLFVRALLAFLALPGVVAFAVPVLAFGPSESLPATWRVGGICLLTLGMVVLLACVVEFYRSGKGTLAPWSPPTSLVVTGLYHSSRNPMYVGVLTIVLGWAFTLRSVPLLWYAAALAVTFHLRVVLGEEPWLARAHGEAWTRYSRTVPRWIGPRRASPPDRGD